MVVALADTGLIGGRGLTGGGDTGLCCCCGCCCCGVCRVVRSILEDSPLLELPLSLALVFLLFAAGSLLLPDDMVLQVKLCHNVPFSFIKHTSQQVHCNSTYFTAKLFQIILFCGNFGPQMLKIS